MLTADDIKEKLHAWQYKALLLVQQFGSKADYVVNTLSVIIAIIAIGDVIWQIGFSLSTEAAETILAVNKVLIVLFALIQVYRLGSITRTGAQGDDLAGGVPCRLVDLYLLRCL